MVNLIDLELEIRTRKKMAKHVWLYRDIISPRFSAEGTLISA